MREASHPGHVSTAYIRRRRRREEFSLRSCWLRPTIHPARPNSLLTIRLRIPQRVFSASAVLVIAVGLDMLAFQAHVSFVAWRNLGFGRPELRTRS